MIYQKKNTHMVKVYDNIIPDKLCQILISAFESCKDQEFVDDDNLSLIHI